MPQILPLATLAVVLAAASPIAAQDVQIPAGSATDVAGTDPVHFAVQARSGNRFEIDSSSLALERAMTGDIMAFAKSVIHDHQQAGEALQEALDAGDVEIPADAPVLDREDAVMLDRLAQYGGKDFEAEYLKRQIHAHQKAVALFRDYASSGVNEALARFASATLPVLEAHLAQAGDLARKR